MTQTWLFWWSSDSQWAGHASAGQGRRYFCSGSLLEVPLRIQCFNLINKMVFPLPNTTGSRYCDYPVADTFFFYFCKSIYLDNKQGIYNSKTDIPLFIFHNL